MAAVQPNMFLIGAPKSGTTSLYEYLYGHPDVFLARIKEPMYFAPDMRRLTAERYVHPQDEGRYLALFDDARDEKWRGEASTRYMKSLVAPRLIRELQPDSRIIAMFRDPVEVLHGLHNERVSNRAEDILDFREALAADEDRRAGRRLPPGGTEAASVYRNVVQFGSHMARWIDAFGRERVHVVLLDDLSAEPERTFRAVLEFLEVDADYRPASFAVHRQSHRRRGGVVGAALRYGRARRLAGVLPRLIGENRAHRLINNFRMSRLFHAPNPRGRLPDDVRDQLRAELEPEVSLLSSIVGRDLRELWWGDSAEGAAG